MQAITPDIASPDDIVIDEAFAAFLPPPSDEELSNLRVSVETEGFRDPLVVWRETRILLDGHNRHRGWKAGWSPVPPAVVYRSFADRADAERWVCRNQLGRRNITDDQLAYVRGRMYQQLKRDQGGTGANQHKSQTDHFDHSAGTADAIAAETGVSAPTVRRDAKFARSVDEIGRNVGPYARADILKGTSKLTRGDILEIGSLDPEEQPAAFEAKRDARSGRRRTPDAAPVAAVVREGKSFSTLEELADIGVRFGAIYADPPWQYGNQGTRAATDNHYPTMSVKEICDLPIGNLAADICHLWLWTTVGFSREAFDVLDAWGFRFKSEFVWVKPQMGLGNYFRLSHEKLYLGVRGTMPFSDKSLMSWGQFNRREHSEKPDQVRQMVEKASPGPRLELFGRMECRGWFVWGNQVARDNRLFNGEED